VPAILMIIVIGFLQVAVVLP
jgi:hypothetical protein